MKAKKHVTIALAALCAAALIPSGALFADADTEQTVYPQDFERELTFESPIRDYAVYGDTFAFAYNTSVCVLAYDDSGERKRTDFTHESEVSLLDYDEEGTLYFKNTSGITYKFAPELTQIESHDFPSTTTSKLDIADDIFYTLAKADGTLTYWHSGEYEVIDNGFSIIKRYADTVYAIKDNLPYKIESGAATPLNLAYTDFNGADHIYSGEAKTALKGDNYTVKTAIVRGGSYCTQVDPDEIGEKFKQINTRKLDGEKPCLVLCETGNASVIATNNGMFITATENLTEYAYTPPLNDWKTNSQGKKAAYAIENVGVYSSPFMCASTRVAELESGSKNVVEVTEKFTCDFLKTVFYRVTFTKEVQGENGENGIQVVTGFVAANFLTEYDFAAEDNQPTEGGDKEFKYETNVPSVILAIIIVGLVIIAVLYISLVGTKKDRASKKKKKKKEKKRVEEPDDYDDEE